MDIVLQGYMYGGGGGIVKNDNLSMQISIFQGDRLMHCYQMRLHGSSPGHHTLRIDSCNRKSVSSF